MQFRLADGIGHMFLGDVHRTPVGMANSCQANIAALHLLYMHSSCLYIQVLQFYQVQDYKETRI